MILKKLTILPCLLLMGCPGTPDPTALHTGTGTLADATPRFPTRIELPYAVLGMSTEKRDVAGRRARVKCVTCHAGLEPRPGYEQATNIPGLHTGIEVLHGDLTCRSCHSPPDFQEFRLVDGRTVQYAEVIKLCAQCHGSIKNDYDNGAHGGMRGYWDLDRGPRDRNHCLVCHDAHQPAVPRMVPAPAPKYRFLDDAGEDSHD